MLTTNNNETQNKKRIKKMTKKQELKKQIMDNEINDVFSTGRSIKETATYIKYMTIAQLKNEIIIIEKYDY